MKKLLSLTAVMALSAILMHSCEKQSQPSPEEEISQDVLAQIPNLGFSNVNVLRDEGGYVVEGDIFLTSDLLNQKPGWSTLTIANTKQYHTTNLITGLLRTITVSVSSKLPATYFAATNEARARYNAENLGISLVRVSQRGEINITKAPTFAGYVAVAGFPTQSGNPYNTIKINSALLEINPGFNLPTIVTHEIGHCIGFRHTDYVDRSFSCGGATVNEGEGNVGAIHIPGTPTGPDKRSWMLSCIGPRENRPFNANDRDALAYLYGN